MTEKQEKCLFSILFNSFGPSKTIDFLIVFSLIFMFFQNRYPGLFLEGPSAELLETKCFLVPFPIFMVFKKAPLGHHFRAAGRQQPSPPKYGERPCRDPAFYETTVILVSLGPSVFKNIIFSIEID